MGCEKASVWSRRYVVVFYLKLHVVVSPEEEWDGVAPHAAAVDRAVDGGFEDIVGPAGELVSEAARGEHMSAHQ